MTWEEGGSEINGQHFTVRGRKAEYNLHMPLLGTHQLENAAAAVAALEALDSQSIEVSSQAMEMGFGRGSWPCRMEIL